MVITQTTIDVGWALTVPMFAFLINWQIRSSKGYAQSAAADFILALAAFDFGALPAHEVFEKAMHDPLLQSNFVAIFGFLFASTMFAWLLIFLPLENKLEGLYRAHGISGARKSGKFPPLFFGSWVLVLVVMAPQVYVFLK